MVVKSKLNPPPPHTYATHPTHLLCFPVFLPAGLRLGCLVKNGRKWCPGGSAGSRGTSDWSGIRPKPRTLVQATEGPYKVACEAGMPQSPLDELLNQIEARKVERDAEKPIGADEVRT